MEQKTNSNKVNLNPIISIISLNKNSSHSKIKGRDCKTGLKKKKQDQSC